MTDRKPLIVGNWKMNANHLEAIQMVQKLSYRLEVADYEHVEVVVAPPFTSLRSVQIVIDQDHIPIGLGAQNVHWAESGAFTGEISAPMLAKLAVGHVIVGHSERRQHFGETDTIVGQESEGSGRRRTATDLVCRRDAGKNVKVAMLSRSLSVSCAARWPGSAAMRCGRWLLPTNRSGRSALDARPSLTTPAPCGENQRQPEKQYDSEVAAGARVLYGGSVNVANIKDIMAKSHVDGALVGGASLDPDKFAAIVRYRI